MLQSQRNQTRLCARFIPELQDRILADAEALKAADRLAMVAMNTGCATQAGAEQLRAYVNAYHKARKGGDA